MPDSSFVQTPLFQLNLMIFLAWPSHGVVKPILREAGFELHSLGPGLSTSIQAQTRAASASPPIPFQRAPRPDLLFRHNGGRQLLPYECKVSSFGPDTDQAKQAASLLTCTGPHIAGVLGLSSPDKWSGTLWYVTSEGKTSAMRDTLNELASRLNAAAIETTSAGCLGIAVRPDGVYLHVESGSPKTIEVLENRPFPGVQVAELEEGDDPRTLYVIPIDPSWRLEEEYERRALEERIRTALASLVGSQLDNGAFSINLEDLMRASIEVWDIWAERDAKAFIKNATRVYAREVFQNIRKLGVDISVEQDKTTFANVIAPIASRVRRYLSSTAFRQGRIDLVSTAVQLDFSSLADGW